VLIAGFVVVCFALVGLGRSHRGPAREVGFRRGFALLIPCFTVPMQVLQLLPGHPTGKALTRVRWAERPA
jgi:hypothetical protein